jgi:YVTN family beta-propeller protein
VLPLSVQAQYFTTDIRTNPFGTSTTRYRATFNGGAFTVSPVSHDCLAGYHDATSHVVTPAYDVLQIQTACSGAWVPYAGASWDASGGVITSGCAAGSPAGCVVSDAVGSMRGFGFLVDGNTIWLFTWRYNTVTSRYAGVYFSKAVDNGSHTYNFSTPTAVPGYPGMGHVFKKGSKVCFWGNPSDSHSNGSMYEVCTSNGGANWSSQLINANINSEGTIWYDSTGTKGIGFSRNLVGNSPTSTLSILTTTNGGATWAVQNSNIPRTTPLCGGLSDTLSYVNYPSPILYEPKSVSGIVTLLVAERQVCTLSPVTHNYLSVINFDPLAVIANPSSLPTPQLIDTGYGTNGQADYGYPAMAADGRGNVYFYWYGDPSANALRPSPFLLTGRFTAEPSNQRLTGLLRSSGAISSPSLLVLNKDDNALAVVDPLQLKVLATVPTGGAPHEVAVSDDGAWAYVSNYGNGPGATPGNTISVIDLKTRKEVQRVDLGALQRPHGIAYAGGEVYFTAEMNKVIARLHPGTNQLDWIMGTCQNRTHMLFPTKDVSRILTSNVDSDTISMFERSTEPSGWTATVIPVGKGPEGGSLSPDEKEFWAANSGDGSVSIIDVAAKKVTQTFAVGTKHSNRLKFTPDGKLVLISDLGGGGVVVVDVASRKVVKRINVGKVAEGILIVPDGSRAYVAAAADNKVVILDLKKLEISGEIATGHGPDGMAWVSH